LKDDDYVIAQEQLFAELEGGALRLYSGARARQLVRGCNDN
jgi:hypothetical protein